MAGVGQVYGWGRTRLGHGTWAAGEKKTQSLIVKCKVEGVNFTCICFKSFYIPINPTHKKMLGYGENKNSTPLPLGYFVFVLFKFNLGNIFLTLG